jgi:hypothetical protein
MAAIIAPNDILAVRMWTVNEEQAAVNTFNYVCLSKVGAGPTDQDLADWADANIGSYYKSLMPPSCEYRGAQVYFLLRAGGPPLPNFVKSVAHAAVGTATGPPLPGNAAGILKYATLFRGPANRGRVFLPFISDDFLATNGHPTNGFVTLVNGMGALINANPTIGSGGNTGVMEWDIVHRPKGGPVSLRGPVATAEAGISFATMKKRGNYGRANKSPI